jgi:hypothetical protein
MLRHALTMCIMVTEQVHKVPMPCWKLNECALKRKFYFINIIRFEIYICIEDSMIIHPDSVNFHLSSDLHAVTISYFVVDRH